MLFQPNNRRQNSEDFQDKLPKMLITKRSIYDIQFTSTISKKLHSILYSLLFLIKLSYYMNPNFVLKMSVS